MERIEEGERGYRVLLLGMGEDTEEKRDDLCKKISKLCDFPLPLLKTTPESYPAVLGENLPFDNAVALARALKSFGAFASVEKSRNCSRVSLEFQHEGPCALALESSYLRKLPSGAWNVIGRITNISQESLSDTWALAQAFDDQDEILSFEEVPIPINPLPSKEASPFKVVFEESLPVKRVSLAFKNASGTPVLVVDRRERREWMEVRWETDDEAERKQEPVLEVPGRGNSIPVDEEPLGHHLPPFFQDVFPETMPEPTTSVETQSPLPMTEDIQKMIVLGEESGSAGEGALQEKEAFVEKEYESIEKDEVLIEGVVGIKGTEQETEAPLAGGGPPPSSSVSPPETEVRWMAPARSATLEGSQVQRKGMIQEIRFDGSIFEEASKLLQEISREPVKSEHEELPPIPWIEDFRTSVERYDQKNRDAFPSWFEDCRRSGGLEDPCRSVLTILTQARFQQKDHSDTALENTQRVFGLLDQQNLSVEQIPPLEGTPFSPPETWRDLFVRAIPKLQQVAHRIVEKKEWNVAELERLIQIIPHMGDRNSRLAIRWFHELIPEQVQVDGSTIPIFIGEGLYRVSARLGVVDPHFDTAQGKNAIGDLKIQAFARTAFPGSPWKIEEPMTRLGIGREEGGMGNCTPTQPQCGGCLFEAFCPKLYSDFNPSEKGMIRP